MEILGHRGQPTATTPENTLAGVEAALVGGADGVEVDVRLTADGVPVCCHDEDLQRTAGVSRGIRSLSLAELATIRVGGHPVPTVRDVLEVTSGRGRLVLDLKPEHRPRALVTAVVNVLDSCPGPRTDVVLSSFDRAVLASCAALAPFWERAAILQGGDHPSQALAQAVAGRDSAVHVPARAVFAAPDLVSAAHRLGLAVRVWTVNRPVDARLLRLLGVDAVISDVPDTLLAALAPAAATADHSVMAE
ncbi:MAG: glycerophosphodiester phosphodiesterase [Mycobacteriales bacterium]